MTNNELSRLIDLGVNSFISVVPSGDEGLYDEVIPEEDIFDMKKHLVKTITRLVSEQIIGPDEEGTKRAIDKYDYVSAQNTLRAEQRRRLKARNNHETD